MVDLLGPRRRSITAWIVEHSTVEVEHLPPFSSQRNSLQPYASSMDPEIPTESSIYPADPLSRNMREETTAMSPRNNFLFAIEALKADIMDTIRLELSKGFESQSAKLSDKIKEQYEKYVEKTKRDVYFYLSTCTGGRSTVQNSKSKTPPLALEHYGQISSREQVIVPFLKWVTLVTVASFIYTTTAFFLGYLK